jgi:hypothetical protein
MEFGNGLDNQERSEMIRIVNVRDDEPGSLIDDESVSDEEKLAFFNSLEKTEVKVLPLPKESEGKQ